MAEFTSNDTILSRLEMAPPSWDAHSSSSSSSATLRDGFGGGGARYTPGYFKPGWRDGAGEAASASWRRLAACPSRLVHGVRPKRLLVLALTASALTFFYLRVGGPGHAASSLPSVASIMASKYANYGLAEEDAAVNDQADLRVIQDGTLQKLSWAAVTDSPQVAVDGTVVKEKGALAGVPDGGAPPAPAPAADLVTTEVCVVFPESVGMRGGYATHLTFIPPKIWQIFLDYNQKTLSHTYLMSWLTRSPSYTYAVLDAGGALGLVGRLVSMAELGRHRVFVYPEAVEASGETDTPPLPSTSVASSLAWARDALLQYARFPRRVLRADFLRYLVLALEGGVYSDMDTQLVRAIHDWVPNKEHRRRVKLIVGLEADRSPPIPGTTYEVQFCQWTLASSPDHPAMWTMLQRILAKARALEAGTATAQADTNYADLSNDDILQLTGPAAWTEVVYDHLNAVAGDGVGADRITWHTLTGMKEPRLYGDTLVLPIDGFATGVPHSGASSGTTQQTMIRHQFLGKWRGNDG